MATRSPKNLPPCAVRVDLWTTQVLSGAKAISNPVRIELLEDLRTRRRLQDLKLSADRGQRRGSPMSRQAVTRHLEVLKQAQLVREVQEEGKASFEVHHGRLFAFADAVLQLTRFEPGDSSRSDGTLISNGIQSIDCCVRPRLVVTYGPQAGASFSLTGSDSELVVGRGKENHIQLVHDPYISRRHACLRREPGRSAAWRLEPCSRTNGTLVNFVPISDAGALLHGGDLVTIGRTTLVFQDAEDGRGD